MTRSWLVSAKSLPNFGAEESKAGTSLRLGRSSFSFFAAKSWISREGTPAVMVQ